MLELRDHVRWKRYCSAQASILTSLHESLDDLLSMFTMFVHTVLLFRSILNIQRAHLLCPPVRTQTIKENDRPKTIIHISNMKLKHNYATIDCMLRALPVIQHEELLKKLLTFGSPTPTCTCKYFLSLSTG